MWRRIRIKLVWGLILLGAIVGLCVWLLSPNSEELLSEARRHLQSGRYEMAENLARQVLSRNAASTAARLIAGDAAAKREDFNTAIEYFDGIRADGSPESTRALLNAASLFRKTGRLTMAERRLRKVLEFDAGNADAHRRLAFLMDIADRRWEAAAQRMELIRQASFSGDDLRSLLIAKQVDVSRKYLEHCRTADPADPAPLIGLASQMIAAGGDGLEELLRKAVELAPLQLKAQALLGRLLLDAGATPAFLQWHVELPASAESHPEIWLIRGVWAQDHGEPKVAARCLWQSIRIDPDNQTANFRIGQLLTSLNQSDHATKFVQRAERLKKLSRLLDKLTADPGDTRAMRETSQLTESLGRLWEAWAWAQATLHADPKSQWALLAVDRIEPQLQSDLPRTADAINPAHIIDLSAFPLPDWKKPNTPDRGKHDVAVLKESNVRFEDSAAEAGIDFRYFNSADAKTPGARIFETLGGGIAVLDFDADGWPDLYFTQGCPWPPQKEQRKFRDRLFRNLGNGQFQDVTEQSGLGDERYSQGATASDFNNDGFPDLYVANIGGNRLYCNNADGTFSDVTAECGLQASRWTTSCLIADLNGDAWPDIYDVNYLKGDDVFAKLCPTPDGSTSLCHPSQFTAEHDQIFLNQGDGNFREVSEAAGVSLPEGRGLGIVAADFDGSGRLSLFIVNDSCANFYYANQGRRRGRPGSTAAMPLSPPRFVEQGVIIGLATNADGAVQGCMGIAAGDANGDGTLDLFVTNFIRESNTLYLQQPENTFLDAARQAGLRGPSLGQLGFGTQFLDADLDGWLDLVLTNGHIDDLSRVGEPYEMPPQFFVNLGAGKFREVTAEVVGDYFHGKYLGRSLARLDWNRDGREDFAVSHLDQPAALLTNRTRRSGHFLAIQLRGVDSDRDAIGATVRLEIDGQSSIRQLTAGDGYQASNQRQLVFGLGAASKIDSLHVRWPSGLQQSFDAPRVNTHLMIIEGRSKAAELPPLTNLPPEDLNP